MALAGDSILVTPGSGATVATHTVSSKEHQVVMFADQTGHIWGSKPLYYFRVPFQVHVGAANTKHLDLFNADAALIVRVVSVLHIPDAITAVTGQMFDWQLARTTAVGTGGTALTAWLPDLNQTALDADITCRAKPTGGATSSTILTMWQMNSEETDTNSRLVASLGGYEAIPEPLRPINGGQGLVLRQNQGLQALQVTAASAGNSGFIVGFTVE